MAIFALVGLGEDLDRHRYQIVQSKRPFDSYDLRWEGRRRVGEGSHCTALEQVTQRVLDTYTVRTRVRMHAYGYTFIARYAHDSTVTDRTRQFRSPGGRHGVCTACVQACSQSPDWQTLATFIMLSVSLL